MGGGGVKDMSSPRMSKHEGGEYDHYNPYSPSIFAAAVHINNKLQFKQVLQM